MPEDIRITITEIEPVNVIIQDYIVQNIIDLLDGPRIYINGRLLMSTASGWVWVDEIDGGTF
ncbi:MAG: hypothetical protein DDT23_00025 [candidate division WS2 bacterium]|nr:hypothetical protein [Candidatus Lithacetigena glycinireducens]